MRIPGLLQHLSSSPFQIVDLSMTLHSVCLATAPSYWLLQGFETPLGCGSGEKCLRQHPNNTVFKVNARLRRNGWNQGPCGCRRRFLVPSNRVWTDLDASFPLYMTTYCETLRQAMWAHWQNYQLSDLGQERALSPWEGGAWTNTWWQEAKGSQNLWI